HLVDNSFLVSDSFYTGGDLSHRFLHQITGSSSISLEVPIVQGEDDFVAGFTWEVVYCGSGDKESCYMELDNFPHVIITDKINGIDFTYTPTFFGIPESRANYLWECHMFVGDYFGYRIKGGEQFEISFIMPSPIKVKQCAVDLIVYYQSHVTYHGLSKYWRPRSTDDEG
ncbi:hypothetical protein LOK49_LG08G02257, partial [Camellia lanceoleosa]